MRTTADYLDALRESFKVPSDYALSDHTGWHRQMVSRYRRKKTTFDDTTAEKVAEWTGIPLAEILVDMNAQRARSAKVRKVWEKLRAAAATTAALALAVTAGHFVGDAGDVTMLIAWTFAAAPLDTGYALYALTLMAAVALAYMICQEFRTAPRETAR